MASRDQPLIPQTHPPLPHRKSWVQMASTTTPHLNNSPLHNSLLLHKLKESTSNFVKLDSDILSKARRHFQFALYGKLFEKLPLFDQVKDTLLAKWANLGEVFISNLPNGFLFIWCSSQQVMQHLITEGLWSINGIILQLSPWKPFFKPSFAKLHTAIIWVQFHNLPVEFWEGETLETIVGKLGTLIKIDEYTSNLVRSIYARVCIDIDLSKTSLPWVLARQQPLACFRYSDVLKIANLLLFMRLNQP